MVIEISPKKIINGAFTVWNQPGPEVDLVMDLKNLTFKENSIDEIYSFHVLDHLFEDEIVPALKNWSQCLKPGKQLFAVVDDFEYLCRALIGGDMNIDEYNQSFTHPTNITLNNLLRFFKEAGFLENNVRTWLADVTDNLGKIIFPKKHFELIFAATKHEQ